MVEEEASEAGYASVEEEEEAAQGHQDFVRDLDQSDGDDRDSESDDTDGETLRQTIKRRRMNFLELSSDENDYNININREKSKRPKTKN